MTGAVQKRLTVLPLVRTGLLLLKTGALVIGLAATDVAPIRLPLKHPASPPPPRQRARLTPPFVSPMAAPAPAVGAEAATVEAVGALGVLAHAIDPATTAAAESLSSR